MALLAAMDPAPGARRPSRRWAWLTLLVASIAVAAVAGRRRSASTPEAVSAEVASPAGSNSAAQLAGEGGRRRPAIDPPSPPNPSRPATTPGRRTPDRRLRLKALRWRIAAGIAVVIVAGGGWIVSTQDTPDKDHPDGKADHTAAGTSASPIPAASRYRQAPRRIVVGATWQPADATTIQDLGYPFVFKAPQGLTCKARKRPGESACLLRPTEQDGSPWLRAQIVVRACPASCRVINRDRSWPESPVGSWRDRDGTTRYEEHVGEAKIAGLPRVRPTYRLSMSRVFRSGGTRYHVGVQVSAPPERKGLARKLVNDIRTQAGAA